MCGGRDLRQRPIALLTTRETGRHQRTRCPLPSAWRYIGIACRTCTVGLQLEGKSAVVTGGASGIGRAVALALAEVGAQVVVADHATDAGSRVAAELAGGADAGHRFASLDVTDPHGVRALFASLPAAADILVNNAGINLPAALLDVAPDDIARTLAVNQTGMILCGQAAAAGMAAAGGGRDYQHGIGVGSRGVDRPERVRGQQGGGLLADPLLGQGAWLTWRARGGRRPRAVGTHRHDRRRLPGRAGEGAGHHSRTRSNAATRRRFRSAAPASWRRSPTSSCSWPRRAPPTSRAP